MDFQCDIYCWEDVSDQVAVCVAGNRAIIDVDTELDGTVEAMMTRHAEVMNGLQHADRVEIDLPHAGELKYFDTLAEAADWLDELAKLGYRMPEGMTDEMRECE